MKKKKQGTPEHSAHIDKIARKQAYWRTATTSHAFGYEGRYIPGNGPSHRLGRANTHKFAASKVERRRSASRAVSKIVGGLLPSDISKHLWSEKP